MVKALTELRVDPAQPDSLNQTPLYYAVREGHSDVIDWLLEKGLNLNHVDTYG
jgi:ankyrin repeat protein